LIWNEHECSIFLSLGKIQHLKYANDNGCAWHIIFKFISYSWRSNLSECFCFGVKHNNYCPYEYAGCYYKVQGGPEYVCDYYKNCDVMECVKYAYESGYSFSKYDLKLYNKIMKWCIITEDKKYVFRNKKYMDKYESYMDDICYDYKEYIDYKRKLVVETFNTTDDNKNEDKSDNDSC